MMSEGLSGWVSHTQLVPWHIEQGTRCLQQPGLGFMGFGLGFGFLAIGCSMKKPAADFSGRAQIKMLPHKGVIWFYCQGARYQLDFDAPKTALGNLHIAKLSACAGGRAVP